MSDLPLPPLRRALLRWYDRARRDLPWRRTRDPYRIWLSEVMLQQTTVAAVLPYYERFLAALPDVRSMAAASEDDVLRLWAGLGYYSRARNLRRAARAVVDEHGGAFPRTIEGLRALPGIGPYTAAALASIAFGLPEAVVDGNVIRVLARLAAIGGDPKREPARGRIGALAQKLLDRRRPGDFNQAVMELGATVCSPRAPSCLLCPWQDRCRARAAGDPERFPMLAPRRAAVAVLDVAVVARDGRGRILLHRIPRGQHNAGLWQLPTARVGAVGEIASDEVALKRAASLALREQLELRVRLGHEVTRVAHTITHYRITLVVRDATTVAAKPRGADWAWTTAAALRRQALTAASRKALRAIGSVG